MSVSFLNKSALGGSREHERAYKNSTKSRKTPTPSSSTFLTKDPSILSIMAQSDSIEFSNHRKASKDLFGSPTADSKFDSVMLHPSSDAYEVTDELMEEDDSSIELVRCLEHLTTRCGVCLSSKSYGGWRPGFYDHHIKKELPLCQQCTKKIEKQNACLVCRQLISGKRKLEHTWTWIAQDPRTEQYMPSLENLSTHLEYRIHLIHTHCKFFTFQHV